MKLACLLALTLAMLIAAPSADAAFWRNCGTPEPGNPYVTGQVKQHGVPCKTARGVIRRFPAKSQQQGSDVVAIRSFTCDGGTKGRKLTIHCYSGRERILWRGTRY